MSRNAYATNLRLELEQELSQRGSDEPVPPQWSREAKRFRYPLAAAKLQEHYDVYVVGIFDEDMDGPTDEEATV